MTHIDTGVQGAKRQSWHHGPRELLIQIIDEIGVDDHEALFDEFCERAGMTTPMQKTVAEYWFANHLHYLLRQRSPNTSRADVHRSRAKARARAEKVSKVVVQRIKLAAGVVLLDLPQPHGKKLRDSTGGECLVFGDWLAAVGGQMKPHEKVGAVFTEKQLQKIYNGQ